MNKDQNGTSNESIKVNLRKEVLDVIQESDVILEVLDVRDPLGTRCLDLEQQIIGLNKRLVIILNKIGSFCFLIYFLDLVPQSNLDEWLKYLRKSRTVLPFKANTQQQHFNLSGGKMNVKFCLSENKRK